MVRIRNAAIFSTERSPNTLSIAFFKIYNFSEHSGRQVSVLSSVVDLEGFSPDPDPALNFFEFRIQAKVKDPCGSGSNPCYLSIFGNCKVNQLKFNHKEESINYLQYIFYFILCTVLQYTKSRIQREITYLFICSFIFCWIHADPDPQHWFYHSIC